MPRGRSGKHQAALRCLLRPRVLRETFGNILVLPLTDGICVDDGAALDFLVWLRQLLEERIDLVLKLAIALSDCTLEFLGLFVPVGCLVDLADAQAWNNVVTSKGF